MAFYVKGAAIEKATGYRLCRKDNDDYSPVASSTCGRNTNCFFTHGYIGTDGKLYEQGEANELYTAFIHIDSLANDKTTNRCVNLSATDNRVLAAFYKKFGDYSSVVSTLTSTDLQHYGTSAENIKNFAEGVGAKYVIFCSIKDSNSTPFVCFTDSIFFALDDHKDILTAGQTHFLVVKAIGEGGVDLDGDGKIYADSAYGVDKEGNPLEYTPAVAPPTATTWYVTDCDQWGETTEKDANAIYYGFALGDASKALLANRVVNAIRANFKIGGSSGTLAVYKLATDGTTSLIKDFTITSNGIQTLKFDSDVTIKSGENIVFGDLEDTARIQFTTANGNGFYVKVPSAQQAYNGSPCVNVGYVV